MIPAHYWCQVQWYMAVFGVAWCDVVVLSTWGFRCYHIEADHDWAASAIDEAGRFWSAVQVGAEPDWQPTTWDYEADRRRHPDIDTGRTVTVLDQDTRRLVGAAASANREAREAVKVAKPAVDEAKAALAHLMGDAGTAVLPDGTVVAHRRARGQGKPFVVLA